MPTTYTLTKPHGGHAADTTVYSPSFHDFGLASDDTRSTGIEHISVTLDPSGGYPGFTVPRHLLRAVPAVSATSLADVPSFDPAEHIIVKTHVGEMPAPAEPAAANKETIYDEQISPLIRQIVAISQAHGIAMLADFDISAPEKPNFHCSTCLPAGDGATPPTHLRALHALQNSPLTAFAIAITSPAQS